MPGPRYGRDAKRRGPAQPRKARGGETSYTFVLNEGGGGGTDEGQIAEERSSKPVAL